FRVPTPPDIYTLPYTTLFRSKSQVSKCDPLKCAARRPHGCCFTTEPWGDLLLLRFKTGRSFSNFRRTRLTMPGEHCFISSIVLRSEEHTSELQSRFDLVCRLL